MLEHSKAMLKGPVWKEGETYLVQQPGVCNRGDEVDAKYDEWSVCKISANSYFYNTALNG